MITRVWRGWTTIANAATYEHLLTTAVFPGIAARGIVGFEGIELLQRVDEREVEFMTLMWFASLDAVKAFAGDTWEAAVVPLAAQDVLSRFDAKAQHFEVRVPRRMISVT